MEEAVLQNLEPNAENLTLTALSYHLYEENVPLDRLLDMCKKEQVNIKDILVSDITEHFLSYVVNLSKEDKDYDDISGFIVLAATLVEMKARSLLPKLDFDDIEVEEFSDEQLLLLRAEEYQSYREAAEKLRSYEILNRFYRDPVFGENEYKLVIKDFSLQKLIDAFSRLLERAEFEEDVTAEKTIAKERFSVAERITDVVEALRAYAQLKLTDLFERDFSKLEIINTFLAVLEIVKQQVATVSQEGTDGEIIIRHTPLTDNYNAQEDLLKDVNGYN